MRNCGQNSQDSVQPRFAAALRAFVGRGREHSRQLVAERLNISPSTLDSYLDDRRTTPSLDTFVGMVELFGPAFAQAVLEKAGVTAVLMDDAEPPCPRKLLAALAALSAQLAAALEDGRIDHTEAPALRDAARPLLPLIASFIREDT